MPQSYWEALIDLRAQAHLDAAFPMARPCWNAAASPRRDRILTKFYGVAAAPPLRERIDAFVLLAWHLDVQLHTNSQLTAPRTDRTVPSENAVSFLREE